MPRQSPLVNRIARRLGRRSLQLAGAAVLVVLLVIGAFTVYAVSTIPALSPWHTDVLPGEYSALLDRDLDFDGYRRLEDRLFDAAARESSRWKDRGEGYAFSRFDPEGWPRRLAAGAPYNRSFRLVHADPAGTALLVHGLTDSPYSMKALAEQLHRSGFDVTVLRLPGHGTFPSMMTRMHYRDWVGATRLAVRDVAARTPPGKPFWVGGYSTGGTLVLSYALDSLKDARLRRPDRVLLISPAIAITPLAVVTKVLDVLAVFPAPALQKVRWQDVRPEFDPYKFNSFPVNASRQVNRATRELRGKLASAAEAGRLGRLPPVITWQSAVDATVGSAPVVDLLYRALPPGGHRLVVFDINQGPILRSLARPAARDMVQDLLRTPRPFRLDVVSNEGAEDGRTVTLRRYAPDAAAAGTDGPVVIDTGLQWPPQVASVGHVALPFPPGDPVYGYVPGSGHAGAPSLGSLLVRGEDGVMALPLGSLTRLRSNPFWSLIASQVSELAAADVAAAGATVP